jgi:RNA polymerase-binding transcription factor
VTSLHVAQQLAARRAQLEAELERLVAPPTEGATVGFGKRVGEGTAEAVERLSTTATARSLTSSIGDIDRALAKIGNGTYGTCDVCGQEIGQGRLEALPTASTCVICASLRQAEGA